MRIDQLISPKDASKVNSSSSSLDVHSASHHLILNHNELPRKASRLNNVSMSQRFCILKLIICSGGGIGGLALAVALSKSHYHDSIVVDIYEAAAEIAEIGAGIAILPRAWEILKILGLDAELTNHLAHSPSTQPSKRHLL